MAAGGSGTAHHSPSNSRKRGYRRAPCPFFFDQRFLRCLGRNSTGAQICLARRIVGEKLAVVSGSLPVNVGDRLSAPIVHLRRNAHRRSDRRLHHARSSDDCRLDDPSPSIVHRALGLAVLGGDIRNIRFSWTPNGCVTAAYRWESDGRHPDMNLNANGGSMNLAMNISYAVLSTAKWKNSAKR